MGIFDGKDCRQLKDKDMVKIDFEHFKTRTLAGVETEKDIKLTVAEDLYQKGQGIAFHALALKIYNGDKDTEYTDEGVTLIMRFVEHFFAPCFIDAMRHITQKTEE